MKRYCENFTPSCAGLSYRQLYSSKVLKDGNIELVPAGREDSHAFIQSFKGQTDIAIIFKKLQNGDTSVLNTVQPMYGDFTSMPGTLAEAMQLRIDCDNLFKTMPDVVRKEFDYDSNKFFASAGSESWLKSVKPALSEDARRSMFPDDFVEKTVESVEVEK